MDDSKISHVDPDVVSKVVKMIDNKFGDTTMYRGKKNIFLGIYIQLKDDGTVEISMDDYVTECIETFGETMGKFPPTPAS